MRNDKSIREIQTDDRTSFKAAQAYIRDTRVAHSPNGGLDFAVNHAVDIEYNRYSERRAHRAIP